MAGETSGEIWLAPGEKIDVYLDMRKSGQFIMKRRNDKWQYGEVEPMRSCYYTGTYGNLQTSIPGMRRYSMNVNSGNFARYDMTAEEYTENVISKYRSLSDSLAASSLPSQVKEMQRLALMQDAIYAMANGDFLREKNYRYVNDSWNPSQKPDIGLDPITADNRKELCKLIDITDRKLLMGSKAMDYVYAVTDPAVEWPKEAVSGSSFIRDLRIAVKLSGKATDAELDDDDMEEIGSISDPFFREALLGMQENAVASLAALEDKAVIEDTPDVPDEELFEAIIAPYKGKTILVDFWNTWCSPCRNALKANEPLKDTELKSDDMVWIYIANETSPIVKYKEMISSIKGKHFRLNESQWDCICEKFNLDGIPSYVLVDKSGNSRLRNDFRDRDKMKETLIKHL